MLFPSLFLPLDCDMNIRNRPAEVGNCKSADSRHRRNFVALFAPYLGEKSGKITSSHLLQFTARAIDWKVSRIAPTGASRWRWRKF